MNNSDVTNQRLSNQLISEHQYHAPAEVVSWLGAIQAQDYAGGKWSIGARLPGVTDAAIDLAVADKMIIRTWMMRGTIHFVAKDDLRWMLQLLAPKIIAARAARYRQLELNETIFSQSRALLYRELVKSKILTRREMLSFLAKANIPTAGQQGYHILSRVALDGVICFGPPLGREQTFVLLEEWVPDVKSMDRHQALAELALRYFTSHGPAALEDFIWWSALSAADARSGLDGISSKLISEKINGRIYWMPATHHKQTAGSDIIYLLPPYDEYLLGYRNRQAIIDKQNSEKISPGGNGVLKPTIVLNGQIAGSWRYTLQKNKLIVKPQPFAPFSEMEEAAFAEAAKLYGDFLQKTVAFS